MNIKEIRDRIASAALHCRAGRTHTVFTELQSLLEELGSQQQESLDAAINDAAGRLPSGWMIQVEVEAGCGLTRLIDPVTGDEVAEVSELADQTLAEQVRHATKYAVEIARVRK